MQELALRYWKHARIALNLLRTSAGWVPSLIGFAALIAALLVVPQDDPHVGDWLGILLIAVLGGVAVLAVAAQRNPLLTEQARVDLRSIALVCLALAALLHLWFGWVALLVFAVGIAVFALVALRSRTTGVPSTVLTGAVALVVPVWCWIALDAADGGLLLLFPLLILGWLADRYMVAALGRTAVGEITLARSYRFLSWLCLLFASVLCCLLAISSDVANSWCVLGAMGALVCIGADLALPDHASLPGKWSRMLIALGFGWLALFWLTSL